MRILNRQWAAVFDLADVTGDGKPDLVYHHQPHGAAHPVTLYAVAGQGNGTFAPEAQRIVVAKGTSGAAMTGIVLEDFNEDGGVDLFLPPDDDVPDDGQAYVVLQGRNGLGKLQPSIDFEPKREGWTADRGHYLVQSCDVDLDGHRDLDRLVLLLVRRALHGQRPLRQRPSRLRPRPAPAAGQDQAQAQNGLAPERDRVVSYSISSPASA